MPDLSQDSATSLSPTHSNSSITAETVWDTVMAEQISHNVVENTESTSAQSLVDVPATKTTLASADAGINEPQLQTKTADLQTIQQANDYATDANALTSTLAPGPSTTDHVAEPSAGDATSDVIQASAVAANGNFAEKASSDGQLANGTHATLNAADGNVEDAHSVDVSVNSDTEGSRGDASEVKQDEKHHNRTNSVKKPATFNKVAVTKNFMAKSATAAPVAAAKVGDKPSPVGTPPLSSAARPRLVAKTGASLANVQKARMGSDGASGPDASKVWNKNRPAAPPPPKQFTDEELKQQYGIHLATRLQTDESGKESKWADIDDDEDDWAPETVVWMDGTKSTLTPHDTMPVPPEQKPASPSPSKPVESVKPPTLAMRNKTELGPTKTILKPGASAAAAQARQNGSPSGTTLVDKSSLKAKSPAPTPAKSPWAQLPPVDKISPINPPVQQQAQAPPFATQDARAYEQQLPAPPAREIAADTFERSWREGEGGKRELFNSSNGRYEPVTEGRRSSIKPDTSARNPAVLQRPSGGAGGPAEPSAAFQTRSTTQTDGPWARRRGSSVSQGSLPPGRRMSITKGPEMSPVSDRRSSTVVGHDMRSSPQAARAEPAQTMFSQQSAWQQQMPPRPEQPPTESAVPEENPVQVQERVMREKRELAIKRRQEEEQRAEAEKQERLKARLAMLEGAGKSRKEREAEAAAAAASKATETPTSEKQPEIAKTANPVTEPAAQPLKPAEMVARAAPALEAQSLPAAPEELRPQQLSPDDVLPSPLPPKPQQPANLPDRTNAPVDPSQRQSRHLSPRSNARAPFTQQPAAYRGQASSYSSSGDRKGQQSTFDRSPLPNTGAFSPWPTAAPNSNVWGTSSGIGNGTFETANVFAPMPMSQHNSSLPPPPGMTRPTSARISPQGLAQESRSPNLQQQPMQESQRGYGPPGFEARPDPFANQARANGASPATVPGLGRPAHAPGPIAPPSRAQAQQQSQQESRAARWLNASQTLPAQYDAEAQAAERKRHEVAPVAPRDDVIKETFKMTSANQGKLGAPRKFEKTEYTIHDTQGSRSVQSLSPAPPSAQTQPSGPFSTASPLQHDSWRQAENTVRIPDGSLNPAHGGMATAQPPIAPPNAHSSSSMSGHGQAQHPHAALAATGSTDDYMQPPPEESSHPVNSGNVSHPLVRLPTVKPTVKLPPAPAQSPQQYMRQQNSMMIPQRPISNIGAPASSRPIVGNETWQARFNGLFNRTPIQTETPPSPPKTPPKMQGPALAVTSSSRGNMDEVSALTGATVSLPQAKAASQPRKAYIWPGFIVDDSEDIVSKPAIERMFTAELSFGSKPRIAVPRTVAYNNGVYQGTPQAMMGPNTGALGFNDGHSKPVFQMLELHHRRHDGVWVSLPTTRPLKKVVYKHPRKPNGMQTDRRVSGKFPRGKGKEVEVRASVPAGPSPASSRKPSGQQNGVPAAGASGATESNHASDGNKRAGPRRGGGRKPQTSQAPQTQAPQVVKST